MIDVKEIIELHRVMVALWHEEPISQPYQDFLGLVCRQHSFNFMLWHEEDIARSPDVSDAQIAAVKRAIDGYNQQRNDAIEKLDEWLALQLHTQGVAPVAGGAAQHRNARQRDRPAIDCRFADLSHGGAGGPHERQPGPPRQGPLAIGNPDRQHHDLTQALTELLDDLFAGRKRLEIYRQFKMYNDPTLNPHLYGGDKPA